MFKKTGIIIAVISCQDYTMWLFYFSDGFLIPSETLLDTEKWGGKNGCCLTPSIWRPILAGEHMIWSTRDDGLVNV